MDKRIIITCRFLSDLIIFLLNEEKKHKNLCNIQPDPHTFSHKHANVVYTHFINAYKAYIHKNLILVCILLTIQRENRVFFINKTPFGHLLERNWSILNYYIV